MLIRKALCPMCGRAAGQSVVRLEGSTYKKLGHKNFWAFTAEFDPDKPFGVVMESTGRGTLHKVGTFQPEEDQEYFPLVKRRLLHVIKEWVAKGWIEQSEVAAAARGMVANATPEIPPVKKRKKA